MIPYHVVVVVVAAAVVAVVGDVLCVPSHDAVFEIEV
jgi:hypothetical protein